MVNPFVPNAPFLYPLKTSENLTFFGYFQSVGKGCTGNEWIKVFLQDSYENKAAQQTHNVVTTM